MSAYAVRIDPDFRFVVVAAPAYFDARPESNRRVVYHLIGGRGT
jgi:hypothetical protein